MLTTPCFVIYAEITRGLIQYDFDYFVVIFRMSLCIVRNAYIVNLLVRRSDKGTLKREVVVRFGERSNYVVVVAGVETG